MTQILELQPDKHLINKDFEKYQFSTEQISISAQIKLSEEVFRVEPSTNQESLLEARLFAFHNHLSKNPYDGSCWFVDKNWNVWRLNKHADLQQIYSLHTIMEEQPTILYNPSIDFTSNNIAVITDGNGKLILLKGELAPNLTIYELQNAEPGVILDVRSVTGKSQLMVAIRSVISGTEKKQTRITLLTYLWKNPESATESFDFASKEVLKVDGSLEYLYIGDNGKYFHSIAEDNILFENPIDSHLSTDSTKVSEQTKEKKNSLYCWSQDEDSITIWIRIEQRDQNKVKVHTSPTELSIIFENNLILKGNLYHRLEHDLTTWKYEDNKFHIDLMKYESGLMWNELVKGDTSGEYIPNQALAAEIHARLAHLCSEMAGKQDGQPCLGFNAEQLEECDLDGKNNILQKINIATQETTHIVMFGANNHVLFTYKTTSGEMICLRHDHDGCVWLTQETDSSEWAMKNVYVFPGFGYVEASKSNKKFCVSPPNGSYVAILEHKRRIFIYEIPNPGVKVAKQWIVDLGVDTYPIMGAAAMNKRLIVLTKNVLYYLQIYPSA